MQKRNIICKYILSFFLVLVALFVFGRHQAVAYAAGSDRVFYFNMDSNGLEGSMMLVESNGHWGLVDAGHRKATTIQDSNGATYSTVANGLSSQVYCRNGRDVANYMVNQLGVTHLDFVVGTHAHSDHVGGIPEVAATSYKDSSGVTRYLVDGNTTYYYKEYQHISNLEDDLAQYSSNSWHNQAFAWQAANAMASRGATLVDVSSSPLVVQGDPNNAYGDYITFNVGNMSFRLYNVHEQTNTGNENVNSIVTVMTNGNYTVVNLADINTNNGAIDKTSQAIAKDYGTVDVVVAGHHGYAGSNTKTMFDSLQPDFVVVPNGLNSSWLYTSGDLAAAMPYAEKRFGTSFYNTGISYYATVTDLSGNKVYVYSVNAKGDLQNAINKLIKKTNKTGWVSWVQTNGTLWSYLEKGNSVKNAWRKLDGKYYRFDKYGIMQTGWVMSGKNYYYLNPENGARMTGWVYVNGQWYYLSTDKSNSTSYGRMLTGWQTIKNKRYYLAKSDGHMTSNMWIGGNRYVKSDGSMATGWVQVNGQWYYMNPDKNSGDYGKMKTGWQTIKNKRYYLAKSDGHMTSNMWIGGNRYVKSDGSMATGWLEQNGKWYYMNPDKNSGDYGKMKTGWQTIKNKRYYLAKSDGHMTSDMWIGGNRYVKSDGSMATGWVQVNGQWYYMNPDKNSGDYGKMKTGWQKINNKKYYLCKDGHMAQNMWVNGKYFNDDGSMALGWKQVGDEWYYLSRASKTYGKHLTGWQKIDGKDYFFYDNGKMAADAWVDGYYVDSSGAWIPGAVKPADPAVETLEANEPTGTTETTQTVNRALATAAETGSSTLEATATAQDTTGSELDGMMDSTGAVGGAENTGDTGDTGDAGDAGNTENTDDTGDAGNTENTDDTGDAGNTENTGDAGDAGNTGDAGDTGDAGNTGDTGNTGDQPAAATAQNIAAEIGDGGAETADTAVSDVAA